MNVIEEHRTEVRIGINTYRVEVIALPGEDPSPPARRVAVVVGAAGPAGESVAEGRIEMAAGDASTLGTVVSDALTSFAGVGKPRRRRPEERPAQQGQPWTDDLDAELERRWQAGSASKRSPRISNEPRVRFERGFPGSVMTPRSRGRTCPCHRAVAPNRRVYQRLLTTLRPRWISVLIEVAS